MIRLVTLAAVACLVLAVAVGLASAASAESEAAPAPTEGENLLPVDWCPEFFCYACHLEVVNGRVTVSCVVDPHGRSVCTIVHQGGNVTCTTSGAFCDIIIVTP